MKTTLLHQSSTLIGGAFSTRIDDEHVQIHPVGEKVSIVRRYHALDQHNGCLMLVSKIRCAEQVGLGRLLGEKVRISAPRIKS